MHPLEFFTFYLKGIREGYVNKKWILTFLELRSTTTTATHIAATAVHVTNVTQAPFGYFTYNFNYDLGFNYFKALGIIFMITIFHIIYNSN